jgi:hypothetical protein
VYFSPEVSVYCTGQEPAACSDRHASWAIPAASREGELRPEPGGTHLTFSSTLDLPAAYRTKVLAGWHWHLDALAGALDGRPADLAGVPGWDQLHEGYLAKAT